MKNLKNNRGFLAILASVLVIGFLLRIKMFSPFQSVDEDLYFNLIRSLQNETFPVNVYSFFFFYFQFILAKTYAIILLFLGFIKESQSFLTSEFGKTFIIGAGRIINAIIGTLYIYVVYRIGKDFYNRHTGLVAAVIVALNSLLIVHSHIFKADMYLAFFMALSLYYLLKYFKTKQLKIIFIASFWYGLAVATKYNAMPMILALLFSVLISEKKIFSRSLIKPVTLIVTGSFTGFLLGSPNWIVHPLKNFSKFFHHYTFSGGEIYEQWGQLPFFTMFIRFFKDFVHYFGPFLLLMFFLGILFVGIRKNRFDLQILVYILSYILITSFSGFYGDRMGIPVYCAIAIIAAKTLFFDLKDIIKMTVPLKKAVVTGMWVIISLLAINGIKRNLMDFNLLKTTSIQHQAIRYRNSHNLTRGQENLNFGSLYLTPRLKGDWRFKRTFIPNKFRKFKGTFLHFIQVDSFVYHNYINGIAPKLAGAMNMEKFIPFYLIKKRNYQIWDPDILLLYRNQPDLINVNLQNEFFSPGRTFYNCQDTLFFPLQTYEKNPAFGFTEKGRYFARLYSREKIKGLIFYLISLQHKSEGRIKINNYSEDFACKIPGKIHRLKIDNIEHKNFNHDFQYNLSLVCPNNRILYFTFSAVYQKKRLNSGFNPISSKEIGPGEIPEIYTTITHPVWIKEYYNKTGIDLSLLLHLNRTTLYENPSQSISDISLNLFPVKKGIYKIRISGAKIVKDIDVGANLNIRFKTYSQLKTIKSRIPLSGIQNEKIRLEITDDLVFIQISVSAQQKNNFVITKITIEPDYKTILSKGF